MIEAIALSILQGITEFIPVSSSGHIFYAGQKFMHTAYNLPFMVSVHMGSALAIVFYFSRRLKKMFLSLLKIKNSKYSEEKQMWKYVLIGSIPAAIAGLAFEQKIEKFTTVSLVGICWIINGLILIFGEILSQKKNHKQINIYTAFFIGVSQSIAILPGISRSGSTITAARLSGMEPEKSFEFSFLLGIIAIFGSFVLEILKKPEGFNLFCITGTVIAFLSGYFSLFILSRSVSLNRMKWFGFYTIIAGMFALAGGRL
ncbi:MAG: undecaprenyl-diphosphate phosphatase [Candidatus Omnitrophica bacterium]|nr:undecaprenyl-diphosphate phosphatase [Candidatus Omnitrophota bacterium]MCM8827695.1 undecaprenyl-diphosphate phosphatase [Candidatus Omnitrophota bacterium]